MQVVETRAVLAAGARIGGVIERTPWFPDRKFVGGSRGDFRIGRPGRELQHVELVSGRREQGGQVARAFAVLQPDLTAAVRHRPDLALAPEGLDRLVS